MKKYLSILIAIFCFVGMAGCQQPEPSKTAEIIDENVPNVILPREIEVTTLAGETVFLSSEDAEVLLEILENGEWYDEPTECFSDCQILIGDNRLTYHSECGTFNGSFRGENIYHRGSLMTDDETQQLMNSILEQYVTLGQYE